MISFLKIFLSLAWLFMVYMVVSTSIESSLQGIDVILKPKFA